MLFDSWVGRALETGPGEDASLVVAAREDPASFGELYRRYVTRVYRYLYSHVGEAAEAEDLTSQVFEAALRGLDSYREQGNFAAWLFRIARNKTSNYHRNWRAPLSLEEAEGLAPVHWDPLAGLEREEAYQRLGRLLRGLEPDRQELLRLRFAADLSYPQIANLLGRSEAAVKMAVHRLLDRLGAEWEKQDEFEA